jgi:hypothetical protein
MFKTTQLLNFRAAIQTGTNAATHQERLDAVIGTFTEYRLPVVTLKDLTVEEVCPIFERINSSGTKLSTYDLMVAATWNKTFDLNDEVDEIRDALEPKGFGDIDRETVLKCMSAVQMGTIKDKALMSLRALDKDQMRSLITKTKEALLKTVDLLSTEFRIYSWEFLSYEALAIIIRRIYSETTHLTPDQVRRVRQWFWRAAFGERYKVGGESFVSNDIDIVRDFVVTGKGAAAEFGKPPTAGDWMDIAFRSNVSRSRAYILALAAAHPKNLTNGAAIDPAQALSSFNKKQFHHVYPRAHLRRIGTTTNDNLVINICIIAAAGNNAISDSDPKTYLPQCAATLGASADAVFSSNLMPAPSAFSYATASYEGFLAARAKIITDAIDKLCNGDHI